MVSQKRCLTSADGRERNSSRHAIRNVQLAGPDAALTMHSERTGIENKWYALKGRVVDAKVEADGDIHIALQDATGNEVGIVSAEIPVGPKWYEIRQTVFGWTTRKFPFTVKTAHTLKIGAPHVVTVTGKAFYDIGHAPADHSIRRSKPEGYAVWESTRLWRYTLTYNCTSKLFWLEKLDGIFVETPSVTI